MREGNTLSFILANQLGSATVTLDSSGSPQSELRYHPFGETRHSSGSTPTNRQFTGQIHDQTTGLYYYNARYYDPSLGRFIQADTIVPEPGNPQSLNRYSYVLNNPLKYIDPSGHCAGKPGDGTDDECWVLYESAIHRLGFTPLGLRHWKTDQFISLFDWMNAGVTFTNDDPAHSWTAGNLSDVISQLDLVSNTLGRDKTLSLLGLSGGGVFNFHKTEARSGTQSAGFIPGGIRLTLRPHSTQYARNAILHEIGHAVAYGLGSFEYSSQWLQATGWRIRRRVSYLPAKAAAGVATEYAKDSPSEDFADTFGWYIRSQHGQGYFQSQTPNNQRIKALEDALRTFMP